MTKPSDRYWNGHKRPASKADFFNAVTTPAPSGTGNVATIRLYGPIDSWGGVWGVSAKDVGTVLDQLDGSVEQIVLRINSVGGEVWEALGILNMLRAHKAKVTAVVDGVAASAASVITAGCEEAVMSPGTQMMIHSPLTFTYGNADDLRKDAAVLDTIEASLIEIYSAKAGDKPWEQMLGDETWMTAAEAVEAGLADRVAVVPDAGEAVTAGDQPPEVIVLLPEETDEPDDIAARYSSLHERFAARAPQTPVSPEPVEPQNKEDRVSDNLKAGLLERLGVTDADASEETLLAALDEALDERAETPTAEVPEGTVLVDATQFGELQAKAAAGVKALAAQDKARREGIVDEAMRDGRISAAHRQTWLDQLEANETSATALLGTLAKNTVPVTEIGHSDDTLTPEDSAYSRVFGAEKKEA